MSQSKSTFPFGTASRYDGSKVRGVRTEAGTSYTLAADDAGKYLRFNNANDIAVTVPLDSNVDFAIGAVITAEQMGAGQVTFEGEENGTTVTVNAFVGLATAGQYAVVQLVKVAANTWALIGGVE